MSKGRSATTRLGRVWAAGWRWLRGLNERFTAVRSLVRTDLAADPYLRYVLLLAVVTCGFGVWFRVPNFAGPDEYSRLIQPMKVAGEFIADPGLAAIRRGLLDGRALGATFYLYALVLAPVFLVVVVTGQLGTFAELAGINSRWTLWHASPEWFWTASILLGRLVSVALGAVCVYLTYRLGVELRDRFTGRLAAVLLALSVGFLSQAHLIGEDLPMIALLLGTILLSNRYVTTGEPRQLLLGAATGGLAIAFKLSGGVAVFVLGTALVLRARRSDAPRSELLRPRLLLGGLAVGATAIYVGIPSVLVGGPDELVTRVLGSVSSKTSRSGGLDAPIWYWLVRQYVQGLGLPLFVAAAGGTLVAVGCAARRDRPADPLYWLLLVSVGVFLLVYSRWEFVRTRHLVPTFPALLVLFSVAVSQLRDRDRYPSVGRAVLAVLVVATALTAVTAGYGYVTEPRDQATAWIESNTDPDATMEVYENSIADVAMPHGRELVHYDYPEERATNSSSLILDEGAYTEWMRSISERQPDYVQLTAAELDYVDPTSTDSQRYPRRRSHIRNLIDGSYGYTVVAEFGQERRAISLREDFQQAVLDPDIDGQESRVVILERTG